MTFRYKPVCVTTHGRYYVFCGPNSDAGQTPFAPDGRSNKYVEIGEGQAYFRHYHDRNDRCATTWNLKSEYPNLHKVFDDPSTKKIFSCPTCVSLGPNGTYFAHLSGGTYWQVSSAIQDEIDMYEVDKMWLGRGSSYVAVFKSGRIQWNFRGKYPELEEKWLALSKSSSPKVVSLSLVDESGIIIWNDGNLRCFRGSSESFDFDDLKRWSTDNLGLRW